jgi:NADPH:quinone reductase-like Zn-dependent oxidoreductase
MKALVPTGNLDDMVRFADVDEPEPAADEVVIAVDAFSLNRGETYLLEAPRPGWRPGKDVAGRVVRAAADGTGPGVGTRVVGHPAAKGWAERVSVPVSRLAEIPPSMTSSTAAALPLAGLTAIRLLRAAGSLTGRRVLMTGAAGGVGHFFTELATAAGADDTVVVRDRDRGRRLRELGAQRVVTRVADAADPMDVILESVGGDALSAAVARLAPRGRLLWFGQAGRAPATLDFFAFFDRHQSATIQHFDYTDSDVSDAADLATLVRLTANGRLHPEIGTVGRWEATSALIASLRARRVRGKAILQLDQSSEN